MVSKAKEEVAVSVAVDATVPARSSSVADAGSVKFGFGFDVGRRWLASCCCCGVALACFRCCCCYSYCCCCCYSYCFCCCYSHYCYCWRVCCYCRRFIHFNFFMVMRSLPTGNAVAGVAAAANVSATASVAAIVVFELYLIFISLAIKATATSAVACSKCTRFRVERTN